MIKPLVLLGDPLLKKKSEPVKIFDQELETLVRDMFDTMYASSGIGLAAVQIGVLKRLFVIDIPEITPEPMVCINPVIRTFSKDLKEKEEGCLSIPNFKYQVTRSHSIVFQYQTLEEKKEEMVVEEIFAICVQHEFDHLEGILFLDRLKKRSQKKVNLLLQEKGFSSYF